MKTYKATVPIDADLMLQLERVTPGYVDGEEVRKLFERWEQESLDRLPAADQAYRERFSKHYGILFMFECGRIFGIQQERARRKARRA